MSIKISFKPKDVTKKMLKLLPERSVDILVRRYGLGNSIKRETLESVGRSYNITRERVRQLESNAIKILKKKENHALFDDAFRELRGVIQDMGGIVSEDNLLNEITKSESIQNHIHFILTIGNYFNKLKENVDFVHRWHINSTLSDTVHKGLEKLIKKMNKNDLFTEEEIIKMFSTEIADIQTEYKANHIILNWIKLHKNINSNQLGDWGLNNSSGINATSIKDMAWLVLRKNGQPMHYKEVAEAINSMFKRKAHSATCHNELIKDDRFVLVGRGMYALKDWGYTTGQIKDIIISILKKHGSMKKKQLIDAVKRERYVMDSTIALNLQNSKLFKKNKDGTIELINKKPRL